MYGLTYVFMPCLPDQVQPSPGKEKKNKNTIPYLLPVVLITKWNTGEEEGWKGDKRTLKLLV